jgi:hypothetical protein
VSGYNNQSDSFDDNGYGQERQESGGGGLRKQLEEVLADNKRLLKLLGDRVEKDTDALLKDKGLDPAIKELIPEGADASEWVEKYAHLLGVKKDDTKEQAKADEGSDDGGPEIVAPEDEDPAIAVEREALSRIQGAADAGSPAHLTGDVLERMERIDNEEELMKFFGSNGAVGG